MNCPRFSPLVRRILFTGAAPIALAAAAQAQTLSSSVGLDGAQETPPVVTAGSGSATVTLDVSTGSVSVSGSYASLGSNQTLAHIHSGAFGVAGGIVVTLSGTGGMSGSFSGGGVLSAGQQTTYRNGSMYLNIHTMLNGGGELRGQIVNLTGSTELGSDPTLVDNAGDPIRGPRIGHATETFNVAMDCSGAGAAGLYTILIKPSCLATPIVGPKGNLWMSGPTLISASGNHGQGVVSFAGGSGITLPNDPSLVGVFYTVQGVCFDPSSSARLSQALVQVIES